MLKSRRLGIRIKGEKGNYYAHTLNNTVVAPPRMLIAFLENNYNQDGSIKYQKFYGLIWVDTKNYYQKNKRENYDNKKSKI